MIFLAEGLGAPRGEGSRKNPLRSLLARSGIIIKKHIIFLAEGLGAPRAQVQGGTSSAVFWAPRDNNKKIYEYFPGWGAWRSKKRRFKEKHQLRSLLGPPG